GQSPTRSRLKTELFRADYLAEYRLNRLLPPERATDLRTVETFKPCGGGSKSVYGHSFHAEILFQNVLNLFFDV
ncbi:MAG TPA: hypothetical protein PKN72_09150, partial [Nitrosomonas europaea]|nr:hypothetical protein [Nitrosomonas europaea]